MNSFWKHRLWFYAALLLGLWLFFGGLQNMLDDPSSAPRSLLGVILVFIPMWVVILEALYRIVHKPGRK